MNADNPRPGRIYEVIDTAAAYQEALRLSREASNRFSIAQIRYRQREIGDAEYLAARREYEASERAFDEAFAKEQGR